jgi:luciferase-like monooxygenase
MVPMTRIAQTVEGWPGVTAAPGSRGEYAFKVGAREIGHLHGTRVAHFGLPTDVWQDLYDAGRIDYHPVFPGKPGFGARAIASPADEDEVISILRLQYDRVIAKHGLPT